MPHGCTRADWKMLGPWSCPRMRKTNQLPFVHLAPLHAVSKRKPARPLSLVPHPLSLVPHPLHLSLLPRSNVLSSFYPVRPLRIPLQLQETLPLPQFPAHRPWIRCRPSFLRTPPSLMQFRLTLRPLPTLVLVLSIQMLGQFPCSGPAVMLLPGVPPQNAVKNGMSCVLDLKSESFGILGKSVK